jgi:hypothetical protein
LTVAHSITIAGQRISINAITDYQAMFLSELFEDERLVIDQRKHSDFLALLIEVIAPGFPKRFYKRTESGYWWLGSATEFGEIVSGLAVICGQLFPQYLDGEPVAAPEPAATEDLEELRRQVALM